MGGGGIYILTGRGGQRKLSNGTKWHIFSDFLASTYLCTTPEAKAQDFEKMSIYPPRLPISTHACLEDEGLASLGPGELQSRGIHTMLVTGR